MRIQRLLRIYHFRLFEPVFDQNRYSHSHKNPHKSPPQLAQMRTPCPMRKTIRALSSRTSFANSPALRVAPLLPCRNVLYVRRFSFCRTPRNSTRRTCRPSDASPPIHSGRAPSEAGYNCLQHIHFNRFIQSANLKKTGDRRSSAADRASSARSPTSKECNYGYA